MSDTLDVGEAHPAASEALHYLRKLGNKRLAMWVESFASTALSGNRTSEVCLGTLRRLLSGESVSDRYLLGLAWTISRYERGQD